MLDTDLSLSTRIRSLQIYAAGMGWPDPVIIAETRRWGISSAAFQALTSVDVVLIQSPDRLRRSAVHAAEIADALAQANVRVVMTDGVAAQSMLSEHCAEKKVLVDRMRRGREQAKARRAADG